MLQLGQMGVLRLNVRRIGDDDLKRTIDLLEPIALQKGHIERQLLDAMPESGEIFVRKVRQAFGGGKVPLALEIIEADRLDVDLNETGNSGNEIRMGVERDSWGRPVAYHFKTEHPGDYPFGAGAVGQKTVRIPAKDVIHLFKQDRPGQTRGVPWVATAIMKMHHLQGYTEAEALLARAIKNAPGLLAPRHLLAQTYLDWVTVRLVEESELLLRWLNDPQTRLVSISGDWASPAAGAGALRQMVSRVAAGAVQASAAVELRPIDGQPRWASATLAAGPAGQGFLLVLTPTDDRSQRPD